MMDSFGPGGPRAIFSEPWMAPADPHAPDASSLQLVDSLAKFGAEHKQRPLAPKPVPVSPSQKSNPGSLKEEEMIRMLFDDLVPGRFGMSIDEVKQGFADKIAAAEKGLKEAGDYEQRLALYQRLRGRFREQYQHVETVFEGIAQQKLMLFGDSISEAEIARIKECSAIQCLGTLSLLVDEFVRRTNEIMEAPVSKVQEALATKPAGALDGAESDPDSVSSHGNNASDIAYRYGRPHDPKSTPGDGSGGKRGRAEAKSAEDARGKKKRTRKNLSREAREILTQWLNAHWTDPYPTQDEKIALSRQAGITIDQVNNWFINARVRTWRPKVKSEYANRAKREGDRRVHVGLLSSASSRADPMKDLISVAELRDGGIDSRARLALVNSQTGLGPGSIIGAGLGGSTSPYGSGPGFVSPDTQDALQAQAQVQRFKMEQLQAQRHRQDQFDRVRGLARRRAGGQAQPGVAAQMAFRQGAGAGFNAGIGRPPIHSGQVGKFGQDFGPRNAYDLAASLDASGQRKIPPGIPGMGLASSSAMENPGVFPYPPFSSNMPDLAGGGAMLLGNSSPMMADDYESVMAGSLGGLGGRGATEGAGADNGPGQNAAKKPGTRGGRISYSAHEARPGRRNVKMWQQSLHDDNKAMSFSQSPQMPFDGTPGLAGTASAQGRASHAFSPFGVGDISPSLGLGLTSPFQGFDGALSPDGNIGFGLGGFSPCHINQSIFGNDHEDGKQN
uniref:Homeobox domain-containing protein n=1 Tax=Pinguiococcus pyrenoidosus TaxID=172671 RepID=A0A7R9YBC1_9STRA|mmetsp:Transcript_15964/g.60847  ORF Transcript_15964/g.60847 Transcript_15964/m.60847 type:complete len:730 (+) Transcript_15964:265-2454(+)